MEQFNIRVYGILINEDKKVLVSDEFIRGKYYTKFPGGGLEFGEGTRDCLKREFIEEMNLQVEVLDHIYTTDFFQESAFRPGDQILSYGGTRVFSTTLGHNTATVGDDRYLELVTRGLLWAVGKEQGHYRKK